MDIPSKGYVKTASLKIKSAIVEWGSIPNRWWYALASGLNLLTPWLLFLSGIVFPFGYPTRNIVALFVLFQLALVAVKVFLNFTNCYRPERKRWFGAAGGILQGTGIVVLYVGATHTGGFLISLAGIAMCAAGYSLLTTVWQVPLSRMRCENAMLVAPMAVLLAALVYLTLSVAIYPFGCIAAAVLYAGAFLIAVRKTGADLPAPTSLAGSVSHSDAFVLQSKYKIYAFFGLCFFAFGYCLMTLFDQRIFLDGAFHDAWIVPLCALGVLALVFWSAFSRRQSVLLNLLSASFISIMLGLLVSSIDKFTAAGVVLLVVGFIVLNVFYLVYYPAICQRKGFSDVRSHRIFALTSLVAPIGLLISVVVYVVFVLIVPGLEHVVLVFEQAALLIILFAMFYDELSRTRKELSAKSETSISLKEIKAFAVEQGSKYRLTDRECEIVQLLMSGRSVAAASKELYLSESTIKTHVRSVYKKLGVHNRQQMIELLGREMRH